MAFAAGVFGSSSAIRAQSQQIPAVKLEPSDSEANHLPAGLRSENPPQSFTTLPSAILVERPLPPCARGTTSFRMNLPRPPISPATHIALQQRVASEPPAFSSAQSQTPVNLSSRSLDPRLHILLQQRPEAITQSERDTTAAIAQSVTQRILRRALPDVISLQRGHMGGWKWRQGLSRFSCQLCRVSLGNPAELQAHAANRQTCNVPGCSFVACTATQINRHNLVRHSTDPNNPLSDVAEYIACRLKNYPRSRIQNSKRLFFADSEDEEEPVQKRPRAPSESRDSSQVLKESDDARILAALSHLRHCGLVK
eukprot:TRINITY_DN12512_c0_g1_i1.p1 TRINITY_DN12512_c0_g1~~TRINITY_DN12512_c0_g1_i1.p1  ORF type:complete len:311 (+),score=18.05 TRINITY_DN12512_c0_g1_i1:85-1017(+)